MDYLIPDDGAGGYRVYDEVSYAFTLPSAFTDSAGKAFVRLVYQPTTKHYIELLEGVRSVVTPPRNPAESNVSRRFDTAPESWRDDSAGANRRDPSDPPGSWESVSAPG
ncbi:hypothetical protein [Sorangium sp. So ce363]|uniref:hypothetical protein n=1 Tax=Sorangium sp. So ce363 TaxID=3133304 RepID=UPI003F63621D